MNEEALEALWFLAFFSILTVIYCAFRYCLAYCENDDDHPTHLGRSLHGIKAAGINPSVLQSIPIVPFNCRDFKDNVECVVCLSELVDGDKTRVLPSCNHCFHADCIDTWLHSDSTCPICRKRVEEIQNNELPLRTNADSGEAYEDMTAVVIDMPAEPDIRVSGLIKASVLNDL